MNDSNEPNKNFSLNERQLEALISNIDSLTRPLPRLQEILATIRLYWQLREDSKSELHPEIDALLGPKIKDYLRYLHSQAQDLVNTASYVESFLDRKGNFIAAPEDDDDWDDWRERAESGTSTIRTRVVDLMCRLGHTPEAAADALVQVCHLQLWETQDYIMRSAYSDSFKDLEKRLRLHIYGAEHEAALAARDYETLNRIRRERND